MFEGKVVIELTQPDEEFPPVCAVHIIGVLNDAEMELVEFTLRFWKVRTKFFRA